MSGYRSRPTKPMVFLWVLIVFAEVGWGVSARTAALLTACVLGIGVALVLLVSRFAMPSRQLAPVRQPSRAPQHRRDEPAARMGVRHRTS